MSSVSTLGGGMLFVWLIAFLICGLLGMWLWPYTINTWTEYATNGEANPICSGIGFVLGVAPGLGQIMIPAAAITWVCDLAFIPDEYPQKTSHVPAATQ